VARQCAEILGALGRGSILEIGAGSGRLAADVLSRLDALGCVPERYLVLEISADLRERQRRSIADAAPHLARRVEWLDAPPDVAFDGVVLANEVLDALPVTRFRWHPRAKGCEEMGVAREGLRLKWAPRAGSDGLAAECALLAQAGGGWEEGYTSEYCERLTAWTAAVTESHRAGLALWIDYGLPRRHYYFPERRDGTLLCHFRQRAIADPFVAPGLMDITAWVDFTRLAQASAACGYALAGYTTQAHFLAGLSIDGEMHHLAAADPTRFARLANEARTLLLPGEMGERFKAMAWLRGMESPLPAFQVRDLRHTL
jgi:SAM-dependent MidA family methyltransferase